MKIDKNVPIPKKTGVGCPSKYPFLDMEVGDSFYIEGKNEGKAARASAASCTKRHGLRFSGRKEGSGHRIWRVE